MKNLYVTSPLPVVKQKKSDTRFSAMYCNYYLFEVIFPDEREQMVEPRAEDMREISCKLVRLRSRALLSSKAWTEKAAVRIGLVLTLSQSDAQLSHALRLLRPSTPTLPPTPSYIVLTEHAGVSDAQAYINVYIHPRLSS